MDKEVVLAISKQAIQALPKLNNKDEAVEKGLIGQHGT